MNSCLCKDQHCQHQTSQLSDLHTAKGMTGQFSTDTPFRPHNQKEYCKNPCCKQKSPDISAFDPHNDTEALCSDQSGKNSSCAFIFHISPCITGHFQQQKYQDEHKTIGDSHRFMQSVKKQIQRCDMDPRKIQNDQYTCYDFFCCADFFIQKINSGQKQHCTATVKVHISLVAGFYKGQGILE